MDATSAFFEANAAAAQKITEDAAVRNMNRDIAAAHKEYEKFARVDDAIGNKENEPEEPEDEDFDELLLDDDPSLRALELKRIEQMKAQHQKNAKMSSMGHGEYREIAEDEFLKEVCNAEHVVIHFSSPHFERCRIVDMHLKTVAQKYVGAKFLHLNAEKAPFFVNKLVVTCLPCIIVFKDGVAGERLVGFEDLGGDDDFKTVELEKWLALAGAIEFKEKNRRGHGGVGISRQGTGSDSEDDSEDDNDSDIE